MNFKEIINSNTSLIEDTDSITLELSQNNADSSYYDNIIGFNNSNEVPILPIDDEKNKTHLDSTVQKKLSLMYHTTRENIVMEELNKIINSLNLAPYLSEGFKKVLFSNLKDQDEEDTNIFEKEKDDDDEASALYNINKECDNFNFDSTVNKSSQLISPELSPFLVDSDKSTNGTNCIYDIEMHANLNDNKCQEDLPKDINVYIILCPENSVIPLVINKNSTVNNTISDIVNKIAIPLKYLSIKVNNKTVSPENIGKTFLDVEWEITEYVNIEIESIDPDNFPLVSDLLRDKIEMVEAVFPIIYDKNNIKHNMVVEINRATNAKPFLGGFKHKISGREYHNASAQTFKLIKEKEGDIERFSRDTQTYEMYHICVQSFNTTSTQMTKPYCYVSNIGDKLIIPGPYETAEQREKRILKSVIIIQKNVRRWLAQDHTNSLRLQMENYYLNEDELNAEKEAEREAKKQKRLLQRMYPKSRQDFDLLYSALEKWRLKELDRINSTLLGPERKAALYLLLEEESELLSAIDRHKKNVHQENKMRNIDLLLGKAAAGKKWKKDGEIHTIDTVEILRCRDLFEIFRTLNMEFITDEARLDILLTVKNIMMEHSSNLSKEICDLVKREGTLMLRGMKDKILVGLRQRISTLFLRFCKTPENNPQIGKFLKFPQNPLDLRGNIYRCRYCEHFLNSDEFPVGIIKFTIRVCRNCIRLNNIACRRIDYSPFSFILEQLRRTEMVLEGGAPRMAFLVNRDDIQYLVEMIWNKKSILSGCDDLLELKLVRWHKNKEWSPWNTALLTDEEAEVHMKLSNLADSYGDMIIDNIIQKQSVAEIYYSRLKSLAAQLATKRRMARKMLAKNSVPTT